MTECRWGRGKGGGGGEDQFQRKRNRRSFYFQRREAGEHSKVLQGGVGAADGGEAVPELEAPRLDVEVDAVGGDVALLVRARQEAQGVQGHLQLGAGSHEQAVDGLVGAQPLEAQLQEGAALAEAQLLDVALVVHVAVFLLVVVEQPGVHAGHVAALELAEEDVLEGGGAQNAAAARVQREPQLAEELLLRGLTGGDEPLFGEEAEGVGEHWGGHEPVQQSALLLLLLGRLLLGHGAVGDVVVVQGGQQLHVGVGRLGGGVVDAQEGVGRLVVRSTGVGLALEVDAD